MPNVGGTKPCSGSSPRRSRYARCSARRCGTPASSARSNAADSEGRHAKRSATSAAQIGCGQRWQESVLSDGESSRPSGSEPFLPHAGSGSGTRGACSEATSTRKYGARRQAQRARRRTDVAAWASGRMVDDKLAPWTPSRAPPRLLCRSPGPGPSAASLSRPKPHLSWVMKLTLAHTTALRPHTRLFHPQTPPARTPTSHMLKHSPTKAQPCSE
mmetsp:Transcript_18813/g.60392  ORF Transcript_18813/g.60392 Transcript_18813/m.60392 type:complete len:215 (+) Transcript_18813:449-1093(+)